MTKYHVNSKTGKANICKAVFVLSLERDLVPLWKANGSEPSVDRVFESYSKQLRLLVTVYSKGWFPRYIIENFGDVRSPLLNYWSLFRATVDS